MGGGGVSEGRKVMGRVGGALCLRVSRVKSRLERRKSSWPFSSFEWRRVKGSWEAMGRGGKLKNRNGGEWKIKCLLYADDAILGHS